MLEKYATDRPDLWHTQAQKMKSFLSLVLIVFIGFSPVPVYGQQDDDVVRVRSNEVRLDVVVTDKRGRQIKDLKVTDFEVLEDGVPQKVESFRFVTRESAPATSETKNNPSTGGTITPGPAKRSTPSVTALVFDRLSPEARALARKAGLAYAQEGVGAGSFTGIFGIDQSLRTVQSFTDDAQLIKDAVERATSTATSTYASGGAKIRENTDRSLSLDQQITTSTQNAQAAGAAQNSAGATAAGEAAGQAAVEQKYIEMQNQMLDHFERLERDQEGFATINSLLAVISPMQNLPGRKTIIFFSEGLKLPPAVQAKFPAVINAANRANVSIYSIDAAGLRIQSGTAEAARELNSIAAAGMAQQGRGNDRGVSGPLTRSLERNEDLLRFDPRSGLGSLSDQTGGFLIHDTNDLVSGLRRIDDDMNAAAAAILAQPGGDACHAAHSRQWRCAREMPALCQCDSRADARVGTRTHSDRNAGSSPVAYDTYFTRSNTGGPDEIPATDTGSTSTSWGAGIVTAARSGRQRMFSRKKSPCSRTWVR